MSRTHSSSISVKHFILFASIFAFVCASVAFGARAWRTTPASTPAAANTIAAQDKATAARIGAEHITIRPTGFEPTEIIRPPGQFLLLVDNHTGLADEVTLRIEEERGQKVREERVPLTKQKWTNVLDLAPGRYILREANHPEWMCTIEIIKK